jgi:predicted dinucleotide-binding enzyme
MKEALIYGAGNIGRDFIGELFSESGYEVIRMICRLEQRVL